jgi:hypothetical protein
MISNLFPLQEPIKTCKVQYSADDASEEPRLQKEKKESIKTYTCTENGLSDACRSHGLLASYQVEEHSLFTKLGRTLHGRTSLGC